MDYIAFITNVAHYFAFLYPLTMAYVWMAGAVLYYFHYERGKPNYNQPPELPAYPLVSILVPCYNEAKQLKTTFHFLSELHYPNFEVIAINDGSGDDTGTILNQLAREMPRMRVVHLAENQGKAAALNCGALAANGEFFVCIDCDAILDHYAVTWIMWHFLNSPRVGAVTGNPRIRNRSTFLGLVQVGEFSAIIGLLKRAQRIYGKIFTVSGVVAAFRRSALHQIGYWHSDTATEDIDVSWRLELNHWDIRFEPRALCWILMPETFRGLFKQRLRWATGGTQAMKKYGRLMKDWRSRRMWGIYAEYSLSVLWSYTMLAIVVKWLYDVAAALYLGNYYDINLAVLPEWQGALLGVTCMLQFALSLKIDSRYDYKLGWVYLCTIWYPLFYWILNWIVSFLAFPRALFGKSAEQGGHWITTDRGIADGDAELEYGGVAPSGPPPGKA